MGNFNRDNKFGERRGGGDRGFGGRDSGRRSFGGGRSFGGRDDRRSSMHQAVCSNCGEECEIPFRPSGDRPVFCSTCFRNQGGGGERSSRFGGNDRGRSRFGDKQMSEARCDACGEKCEVPFRPTKGKPVYCSQCFGKENDKGNDRGGKNMDQYKKQFEILNAKLDKILKALHLESPEKEIKKEVKDHKEIKKEIKEVKENKENKEDKKEVVTEKKKETKKPKDVLVEKKPVAKKIKAKKGK